MKNKKKLTLYRKLQGVALKIVLAQLQRHSLFHATAKYVSIFTVFSLKSWKFWCQNCVESFYGFENALILLIWNSFLTPQSHHQEKIPIGIFFAGAFGAVKFPIGNFFLRQTQAYVVISYTKRLSVGEGGLCCSHWLRLREN